MGGTLKSELEEASETLDSRSCQALLCVHIALSDRELYRTQVSTSLMQALCAAKTRMGGKQAQLSLIGGSAPCPGMTVTLQGMTLQKAVHLNDASAADLETYRSESPDPFCDASS